MWRRRTVYLQQLNKVDSRGLITAIDGECEFNFVLRDISNAAQQNKCVINFAQA